MARGIGVKNYSQRNTTVKQQLDILGQKIVKEAKQLVKSDHYDTGQLYNSLKYVLNYTSDNSFKLVIQEMYYGKFVNGKDGSNGYMTKAIEDNIDKGIKDIIDVQINEITSMILDENNNKVRLPKR